MLLERISALLVLVATSGLALAKPEALWGHKVFPDDLERLSIHGTKLKAHRALAEDCDSSSKVFEVCETKECKIVATEFLSSMNKAADPCQDFYNFTCGAWTADKIVPPSMPQWSRFKIFDMTAKHRVKGILEAPTEIDDILPLKQAKKWYKSCMDTEVLDRRGVTPIESVLMHVGGWPIAMDEEEWDSEEYTWRKIDSHYARLLGHYRFFSIRTLAPSDDDSHYGALAIMDPTLTLSDLPVNFRNYSGDDYDAYVELVEEAARFFVENNKANVPEEKLKKEAREIVEFEKEVYQLIKLPNQYEDLSYEDLGDFFKNGTDDEEPEFNLKAMLDEIFDSVNVEVHPEVEVLLFNPDYLKGMNELIAKTPKRTLANYLHWTFVGDYLKYTTEAVRNEFLKFNWAEFGIKERSPRWLECVEDMKMTHAAAFVFVEKYYPKTTDTAVMKMIKNIQKEMEERIEASGWMDEKSKAATKDKLRSMKFFVGHPDWYRNRTAVINYYKGITIGSDYFDNMISFARYDNKKKLKDLVRNSEEKGWYMDPITVNALYVPDENLLNAPAVAFQAPLFTKDIPNNINYGIAGVVVGHEIGHGFDDSGIKFGKAGNMTSIPEKMLKNYYKLAECFTDQFEEYYREGRTPDPEAVTPRTEWNLMARKTRGENIADTTGIQAVFEAYKSLKQGGVRLPGLEEFTDDQMFFISFAAMWCSIGTPQYEEKLKEAKDVHSPANMRVIGAVSNAKAFAKVFKCPAGSPMNPTNKCDIWDKSKTESTESKPSLKKSHPWTTEWNF